MAEQLLAPGAHLGDAVRVEDDQLAGRELDRHVGQHRLDLGAEQRPEPADRLDRAGRAQHERQRVPAAGERHAGAARVQLEVAEGDGAEAAVVARLAQRAVQMGEDGGRPRLVLGRRAQRVARERGDRRRLGPLPQTSPISAATRPSPAREDVVEVAADLDPLAGRDEAHGDGEAGDRRYARRQQRALQHLGDVALARVGLRLRDRDRGELAELREDRLVARRERAVRVVGDLERAERAAGAAQHHADRRRRRARVPDPVAGTAALIARAYGSPARPVIVARRAPSTRCAASTVSWSDLLGAHRGVDLHRRLGERPQLGDVLVLEPRDLLHLVVAAVGDLEDRERLAEERPRRLEQLGAADGVVDIAHRGLRAAVVLLGELEQAGLGADGLAPERVRRAELLLVPPREPGAERVAVAIAERVRWRGGWGRLGHPTGAYALAGAGSTGRWRPGTPPRPPCPYSLQRGHRARDQRGGSVAAHH